MIYQFQEDSHWDVKHNQSAKGFNAMTPPSVNGTSQQQSQSNNQQFQYQKQQQNTGPQKLGKKKKIF